MLQKVTPALFCAALQSLQGKALSGFVRPDFGLVPVQMAKQA
jgi:hypothetical protein